jgi:hypothetical protein
VVSFQNCFPNNLFGPVGLDGLRNMNNYPKSKSVIDKIIGCEVWTGLN